MGSQHLKSTSRDTDDAPLDLSSFFCVKLAVDYLTKKKKKCLASPVENLDIGIKIKNRSCDPGHTPFWSQNFF